jgi:hypothetical protein|nr:hypothetical protein [Aeromicrobium sp.]
MTSPSTEPQPTSDAPDESMDASVARRATLEMAALTRVLFGVTAPLQTSMQPDSSDTAAPADPPAQSVPVTGIPVPRGIPAPQPTAPTAPTAPAAPASLPVPDIPVLASVPAPAEGATEPARETPRRPAGPSLELLQEISFLEE